MVFRIIILFLFSFQIFSASSSFLKLRDACNSKNGKGFSKSTLEFMIQNDKSFNINENINGITLLMQCTGAGRADEVNNLLENGAFVDAQNNGQTALFTASAFGWPIIVSRLLKAGANKNLKDKFGLTAADYANRSGHYQIVEMLGGKPQNLFVDEKRQEAYEILSRARKNEISAENFKRLFAPYGPLIDEPTADGHTLLQFAAYYGRNDLLRAAISLKAGLDTPNPEGTTPLMFAAMGQNLDGIKILTEAGANQAFKNKDGKTANDFAEDKAKVYLTDFSQKEEIKNLKIQKDIVDYLKKSPSKFKAKILANQDKIMAINKELIAKEKAKANEKKPVPQKSPASSPKVQTMPFTQMLPKAFQAIEAGNVSGLNWLLDNGLPPDARAPNGQPIINQVVYFGNIPMLQSLVSRGADLNIRGVDGFTPLMVATRNFKYDVVAYLVKIGADKKIKNNFGWTAMDFARQNRDNQLMYMTRF